MMSEKIKKMRKYKVFTVHQRSILEFLIVTIIFSLLTVVLTGGVFTNIATQLYTGGIGDATSGFLWIAYADKGLGYLDEVTKLINYPIGESLWSPIYITWTFAMFPLWVLSRIFSPITALNVVMLFGFVSCAVAGYYFLKRVTKDRYLSFVGAYAIAFVPYHLFKAPEHLTNIFVWPFIGFIAFMIAFWRKQTIYRGIGLAVVSTIALYTDGYFIFILAVLGLALGVSLVIIDLLQGVGVKPLAKKVGKLVGVSVGVLILALPIVFTQLTAGKEVAQDLSNSRDEIKAEVQYYATKPIDFLLPPEKNITISSFDWFNDLNTIKNTRSNSGENTNYIGVVIIILVIIGTGIITKRAVTHFRSRRSTGHAPFRLSVYDHVWVVMLLAVPFVLVWMLPPAIHVLGLELKTPIGILIDFVSFWRVPARVFLVLHVMLVIIAILTLGYCLRKIPVKWRYVLLTVVWAAIAVDYYTGIKRPAFGLDDMPKGYSWVRDQNDIKSIAELPLVDWPVEISGYYMFAQLIHNKPIVNSGLARTGYGLYNPLSTVDNNETIRFLRQRGVDTVILHTQSCKEYNWGKLRYHEDNVLAPMYIGKDTTSFCVYSINNPQEAEDALFVKMKTGFSKSNYLSERGEYWVAMDDGQATIDVVDALGKPVSADLATLNFRLSILGEFKKQPLEWKIIQNETVLASGVSSDDRSVIEVKDINPKKTIHIEVRGANSKALISKGEAGLGNVVITKQ